MIHNPVRMFQRVTVVLICTALLVLSAAAIVSPPFVARHLSADGVLERLTVLRIQFLRVCAGGLGLLLASCGALATVVVSRAKRRDIEEPVGSNYRQAQWRTLMEDVPAAHWLLQKWDRGTIPATLVLLGVFSFYLLHVSPAVWHGDCAVFNEQIKSMNVTVRTVHFGYFVQGIIFTHLLPWLDVDLAMNIMACLYGAAGVGATFLLVRYITGNTSAGFVAAFVLAFANDYMCSSLFCDHHAAQAGLGALAVLAWFLERPRSAGRLFLHDMLVTPHSFVVLPVFLGRRWSWRELAASAVACVPAYLLFLAVFWRDWLLGPRGVLKAGLYYGVHSFGDLLAGYKASARFFAVSFSLTSFLVIVGLSHSVLGRHAQLRRFALGCAGAICLHLIIGGYVTIRGFDIVIYPLIAAIAGVGFHACTKTRRARVLVVCAALLAVLCSGWVSYSHLVRYVHYVEARDRTHEELAFSEKARWFSTLNWDARMMYEWKAFRRTYTEFFVDPKSEDFHQKVGQILTKGEPFWVLGDRGEQIVEKVLSKFPNVHVDEGPAGPLKWWRISSK